MMTVIGQIEKKTLARVVALFRDRLLCTPQDLKQNTGLQKSKMQSPAWGDVSLICPAPVSMPRNPIAELSGPEQPGRSKCNQKLACRHPGQLVLIA
ncbi:MAG: hypothetical protein Q8L10_04945 [Candidatus Moranbacteria bacterium]|nr:hypothetical protein [Candidatus Moranbacteria bacterium]